MDNLYLISLLNPFKARAAGVKKLLNPKALCGILITFKPNNKL